MEKALISNIQGYSIHDGPGIRTVVFIKGCPMRCRWCANPENLENRVQVGFVEKLCSGCGECAKVCPNGAIVPEGYRIDKSRCKTCLKCVDECLYSALVRYGSEMTSKEVFEKVRKDKMFYDSSSGGVTVSGGEPLTKADFVFELFEQCKNEGINTCAETCGMVPQSAFEKVLKVTDLFYFDLKIMNDALHKEYTGCSNEQILSNARYIAQKGAKILFRQPLIPGVNDTDENIESTSAFIKSLGRNDIALQLMPYHRAGQTKYEALNIPYAMAGTLPPDKEHIESIKSKYIMLGIDCSISK